MGGVGGGDAVLFSLSDFRARYRVDRPTPRLAATLVTLAPLARMSLRGAVTVGCTSPAARGPRPAARYAALLMRKPIAARTAESLPSSSASVHHEATSPSACAA